MPGAVIVANQPTGATTPGTPGVARNDLWQGQIVNLTVGTAGNSTFQWELLAKPPGSAASLTGPTTSAASFLPDLPGTYRIRLTTNGGGAGNVQTLVFRVRFNSSGALTNRGWALPAFGEVAGESNYGGNVRGWIETLEFIFADLLANAFTGGGGGGLTSIAGLTGPAVTLSNGGGIGNTPLGTNIALKIAFPSEAQGDVTFHDGSGWVRYGAGVAGQALLTGGVGANPAWGNVVRSLGGLSGVLTFSNAGGITNAPSGSNIALAIGFGSDAQGDIPVRGLSAYGRLALGGTGTVLTSNGTTAVWASVPVSSVAGLTGAITYSNAGGVSATPSGSNIALAIEFGSDAQGDIGVRGASAYGRLAKGAADTLLGVNGAGTTLAYTNTPWLTGLRAGMGGSVGGTAFGTAPIQAQGDTANGQAIGLRADPTSNKALASFFDGTSTQKADVELDAANSLLTVRGRAIGVRITTDAGDTKIPVFCEASTENVGLAGATSFSNMVDGIAIGLGGTAPTSVSGTAVFLFNSGGIYRQYATGGHGLFVSATERLRVFSSEVAVAATNFSIGQTGGSYGGGSSVVFVRSASTNPTTNPTGGHIYYGANGTGEPLWRLPSGAIRSAVTAGASVASGLFVAPSSAGSPTTQLNKRTFTFSDGTTCEVLVV